MTWLNNDGLFVKIAREEGVVAKGGSYKTYGPLSEIEAKFDYTDVQSATAAILGSASTNPGVGSLGILVPEGVRIEEVEIVVETAFTSSGTIGTATLVTGLIDQDRSSALDDDGFTTTSFTGGSLDARGEKTVIRVGSTGAGALIGATTSAAGFLVLANSQHASHPFTAGKGVIRIRYYNPQTLG